MTFYQELQLNSAGSKALIRITEDKKERRRHILIYNFKVYLVVAFCFAAVTLFSMVFGSENSIAGVAVLLALLVLRQADFGIHTSHGLLCIAGIFSILMAGPRLTNAVSPFTAFFINLICILILMFLGCHNILMSNHSTFVLSYLILQGYDVTGHSFVMLDGRADSSVCFSAWRSSIRIRSTASTSGISAICSRNLIRFLSETGGISS